MCSCFASPLLTSLLLLPGDVQPYVALGKRFQKDGHRVRLGTHETFRKFVEEENGLEFFDIGGNPQDLMSYMVKSADNIRASFGNPLTDIISQTLG